MSKKFTKDHATIMMLFQLITKLNPKLSQFRPYIKALDNAEEITKEFKLVNPDKPLVDLQLNVKKGSDHA